MSFKNINYKVRVNIITTKIKQYSAEINQFPKKYCLNLTFFRLEQFVEVQTVKSLQFTSIPVISRGKISLCETLKTIRQRISR